MGSTESISGTKKVCIKCKLPKPLEEFYNRKESRDGRSPYCKECHRAASKKASKKPKAKRYRRKYAKAVSRTPKGAARRAVNDALKVGAIQKDPVCRGCKKPPSEVGELSAHHWATYEPSDWFKIDWLCRLCHEKADAEREEKLRATTTNEPEPDETVEVSRDWDPDTNEE